MQTLRIVSTLSHLRAVHNALRETFLKAGFELGFDHWGTICPLAEIFGGHFHFYGGQKFVHPSADAKGFVLLAGLLIGLGRKSQISRDF